MAINRQLTKVAILEKNGKSVIFPVFSADGQKNRTIKQRKNPFDDFDEVEFKMRFRLAKTTVNKLLEQVTVFIYTLDVIS